MKQMRLGKSVFVRKIKGASKREFLDEMKQAELFALSNLWMARKRLLNMAQR